MSDPVYFVWDVESTGIRVLEDRVVQFFGATADAKGNLIDTWEFFIDPGVPVPEEAAAIHGFSDEFLAEHGEDPVTAFTKIRDLFLENRRLIQVAFNMSYDLSILHAEMVRHGVSTSFGPWFKKNAKLVDGLVTDRHHDRYRKGKRTLAAQADHYGIEYNADELHNAIVDVELTAKVTVAILEKFGTPTTRDQEVWYRGWAENFEQYLRKTDPDAEVDKEWPLRVA